MSALFGITSLQEQAEQACLRHTRTHELQLPWFASGPHYSLSHLTGQAFTLPLIFQGEQGVVGESLSTQDSEDLWTPK